MERIGKAPAGAVGVLFFFFALAPGALANTEQAKIYKSVFGEKPKCISCHVDKLPKKAEGKHDFNEYGKSLRAVQETPDEETYKKIGKNEKAELAEE